MLLDASDLPDRITIVHRPAPTSDAYGNDVFNWSTADRDVDVAGSLQPATSTEDVTDRDAVISDYVLYLLPDQSISAFDRVELATSTYEVRGDPQAWRDEGTIDHLAVQLQRITA